MQQNKKLLELIKDYKIIFNTDEGKRVLDDLKKRSHFYNTTHVQGDSHESAYNEGQRSLVVFMETLINHKE
jgi:polyhydroxyalkanoate synthesis regulator phasin